MDVVMCISRDAALRYSSVLIDRHFKRSKAWIGSGTGWSKVAASSIDQEHKPQPERRNHTRQINLETTQIHQELDRKLAVHPLSPCVLANWPRIAGRSTR